MSARDAVRMGDCIADGTAAGPKWTEVGPQRDEPRCGAASRTSRTSPGGGRWGIIDGLPAEIMAQGPVSIKNGWTPLVLRRQLARQLPRRHRRVDASR